MQNMDIDIEIYLKRIRAFFESQKGDVEKLLNSPGVDLDLLMEQIQLIATENYKELADPTLTKNQILIAVNVIKYKKLNKNRDLELIPIQVINGFEIYLN
jgi:adenylate cyclase|tara:strand:- start:6463 stop:6762 length:300 start_codon:yes stop_codon:yes gene_type:complete